MIRHIIAGAGQVASVLVNYALANRREVEELEQRCVVLARRALVAERDMWKTMRVLGEVSVGRDGARRERDAALAERDALSSLVDSLSEDVERLRRELDRAREQVEVYKRSGAAAAAMGGDQ